MRASRPMLFFLCLSVIGFCFPASQVFSQAKPIELTYAQFQPAAHFNTKLSESYAKEIEKRTPAG